MIRNQDFARRPAALRDSRPPMRRWRRLLLCGLSALLVGCSTTPRRVAQPSYKAKNSSQQATKPTRAESLLAWENVGNRAGDAGVGRLAEGPRAAAETERDIRLTSGSNSAPGASIGQGSRMMDDTSLGSVLKTVQGPAANVPQGSSGAPSPLQAQPGAAISTGGCGEVLGDMASSAPLLYGGNSGSCGGCGGCTRNWGVACDGCGWRDNFSARIGGTVSGLNDFSTMGGILGVLESTAQLRQSNVFLHSGFATEYLDDRWPIAFTVGFSRLARLKNNCVEDPWIFSFTYDGYWDDGMFGVNDTLYMDQIRVLAGYAVLPRLDVGAWGAVGLRRDHAVFASAPVGGVVTQVSATRRFADRVAGYCSFDLNDHGAQVIGSLGYEESPGYMFYEIDGFFPIRRNVNLFAGLGYSTVGSFDAVVGLEFLYGLATKQRRPCPVGWDDVDCRKMAVCDPHDRFRGGWANGNYRSALRVVTPSRVRRSMDLSIGDPQLTAVPGVQDDPPSTGPNPPQPPKPPHDPPPKPKPTDLCPPRLDNHTKAPVKGRLAQWLEDNGKTVNVCDPNSFQPHTDL